MYRAACWQTNDGCKLVELIRWQLKPFCSTLKHFVVELDRLFLKLVQFGAWLSARSISYTTLGQWLWILPWKCCLASWSSEHACLAWTWTTLYIIIYIINIYIYIYLHPPKTSKTVGLSKKLGFHIKNLVILKGPYFTAKGRTFSTHHPIPSEFLQHGFLKCRNKWDLVNVIIPNPGEMTSENQIDSHWV